METKVNSNAKRTAIKVCLVTVFSLLLLIPLALIKGEIEDREQTKNAVIEEVALPVCVKVGEMIDFAFPFDLKGTESLFFHPSGG